MRRVNERDSDPSSPLCCASLQLLCWAFLLVSTYVVCWVSCCTRGTCGASSCRHSVDAGALPRRFSTGWLGLCLGRFILDQVSLSRAVYWR